MTLAFKLTWTMDGSQPQSYIVCALERFTNVRSIKIYIHGRNQYKSDSNKTEIKEGYFCTFEYTFSGFLTSHASFPVTCNETALLLMYAYKDTKHVLCE